jgi:lipoate-protein ligase A
MSNYHTSTWRLILAPRPQTGPQNMATDEALLRAVAARQSPPTLRLYAWSPPAMTLGRGQSFADADLAALQADGVTLLRRATGGTAVFHADELTYSVAATDTEPRFASDVVESYRGISGALVHALECIGLHHADASPHAEGRSGPRSPVCFEVPSDYEITVDKRKLFGSAQMRIRGSILQHGTLPLTGDIARVSAYLATHPDPERVRAHTITLHEALGREVAWHEMAQAIISGFTQALNLNLVPASLSPEERTLIDKLVAEKYANDLWTRRIT